MAGHTDGVLACDVSANQHYLASASMDGTVRVWALHTGACVCVLGPHQHWCNAVRFSRDMQYLLTGSVAGELFAWRLHNCASGALSLDTLPDAIPAHRQYVHSNVAAGDSCFITAAKDNTVRMWSAATKSIQTTFTLPATSLVVSMALLPSQSRLAIVCLDRSLFIFDSSTGALQRSLHINMSAPICMSWADQDILLIGTENGTVCEIKV
jgi:WD40 repeat protein